MKALMYRDAQCALHTTERTYVLRCSDAIFICTVRTLFNVQLNLCSPLRIFLLSWVCQEELGEKQEIQSSKVCSRGLMIIQLKFS